MNPRPFRYLRDPLFLACVALYFVNRFVFKRIWTGGFVHEHFNDLICIPFWVPIMLWAQHRLGLRPRNGPPMGFELLVPLLVWSWVFELILPATGILGAYCVSDYRDILWYAVGTFLASTFWRWWYAKGVTGSSAPTG